MSIVDPKIVFLAETFLLLTILFFGRNLLKKRIVGLFSHEKIPPFYIWGFRLLLGIFLLEKLFVFYNEPTLLSRPVLFYRFDTIFELFFHSDYRFIILIITPLIFVTLFVFERKPRLASTFVFLYSVIVGSAQVTMFDTMPHDFHLTTLLLLGFALYYWFWYKPDRAWPQEKNKVSNEWILLPISLFFITTIYGASFFSKMSHLSEMPKWFSGEAIQSVIIRGHFKRAAAFGYEMNEIEPVPKFIVENKAIASFLGIGALLSLFSSFFLLIVSSRLRLIILISFLLFNILAAVLFLLYPFTGDIITLVYIIIWAAYSVFAGYSSREQKKY